MAFELRNLLYCAGVIVCLGLLFSAIPTEIITPSTSTPTVPNAFAGIEMGNFDETYTVMNNYSTFNDEVGTGAFEIFSMGGKSWIILIDNRSADCEWMQVGIRRFFLGVWVDTSWLDFKNVSGYLRGTNLTFTEMSIDDNTQPDTRVKYTVTFQNDPTETLTFYLCSRTDEYPSAPAFHLRYAALIFGYGVSNETTDLGSGLGFFLQLLTFQTPNIHPWVNVLAWVVIGVPAAYVVFELLRSLIPFLS